MYVFFDKTGPVNPKQNANFNMSVTSAYSHTSKMQNVFGQCRDVTLESQTETNIPIFSPLLNQFVPELRLYDYREFRRVCRKGTRVLCLNIKIGVHQPPKENDRCVTTILRPFQYEYEL